MRCGCLTCKSLSRARLGAKEVTTMAERKDIEESKSGKEEHPEEIPAGGEIVTDALPEHKDRGCGSIGNDRKPYKGI